MLPVHPAGLRLSQRVRNSARWTGPVLEPGGKNPMVTARDADLDLAVEGALFARLGTADQRCTSPGSAITHESVHGEFLCRFDEAVRAMPMGDPAGEAVTGRLLGERFARFEEYRGWIGGGHRTCGLAGIGRVTAASPQPGLTGGPSRGLSTSGGGAPTVRRQRQVGQRQPTVLALGARSVHPVAGAELGLLRAPKEGQMAVAVIEPDLSFRLPVALGTTSRDGSR
jgi:Aldehyde dehydrogenase family